MPVSKALARKTNGNSHSSRKAKERESANPKVSRFPSPLLSATKLLQHDKIDLEVPRSEYPHSFCTTDEVKQEVEPAPMSVGLLVLPLLC